MTTPMPRRLQAFSLIELLVAVSVLAVLAAASMRAIVNDLQRSRLNAVSQEFGDWVESIRKAAQRTEGGCEITVANLSNAAGGATLAAVRNLTASDAPCSPTPTFLYRASSNDGRLSSNASTSVIIFTPRGTILGTGDVALPNEVQISLALQGVQQLRCLRLSGLLGAIQIGSDSSTNNVGSTCPDASFGRF